MSGRLALAVTACFALAALWLTIRAWQVRSTTPRTTSLALSSAACIAILIAAADLPIPLAQALCEHSLNRSEDASLTDDLEHELQSWIWRLRPCRRLQVETNEKDLETALDFPRLSALAAASGVAIDVDIPDKYSRRHNPLRLEYQDKLLPTTMAIPASRTNVVTPRFDDERATKLSCRIDDSPYQDSPRSIDRLLQHTNRELYRGFHRLQCYASKADPDTATSLYIHISASKVLLFSDDIVDAPTSFSTSESARSFEIDAMTRLPELPQSPSDHEHLAGPAAMLVFDRPKHPESCRRAREALAAGTSVVIAMPDHEFVTACPDLLPIQPGGPHNDNKLALFDREPRLTYILDDFADDLPRKPSCILSDCKSRKLLADTSILPASREDQLDKAHASCEQLTADTFHKVPECPSMLSAAATPRGAPVRILDRPRRQSPTLSDLERIQRSAPHIAVEPIVTAFNNEETREYYENELIVAFSHDPQPPMKLHDILETGSRVHVAIIKDPYGLSLRQLFGDTVLQKLVPGPHDLVTDPDVRYGRSESKCKGDRCAELSTTPQLAPDSLQTQATLVKLPRSRFLTDINGSPAPLRFGWWKPKQLPGPHAAATIARTTLHGGLKARPLAFGAMIGRGHLLLLGYSPFESGSNWKHAPVAHSEVLGGYRLIENLYSSTAAIPTGAARTVQSVALQPDGAVWVTMTGMMTTPASVIPDHLEFTPEDRELAIDAPLVDFDDARGLFTYALPARELSDPLRRPTCREYHHDLSARHDPVVACPPAATTRASGAMHAATLLRLLAGYTGGNVLSEDPELAGTLRTRPLGLAALSIILLLAWSRRAARRLSGTLAQRRLRHLEHVSRRRYDPPDAVVAAAGDWDGRSSTWPRTGAFGGYRPLEAGDRPSAIVLQDLVLPALGGPQLLPRVMQRIEEGAPGVLVLVNLGDSMRVPRRSSHDKASFAGQVAHHVAASAWKIRGEVEIHAVGITGETEIVASTRLSPGHDELGANIRACLARRPLAGRAPWPDELPECGSVVYISDFQLEDMRAFQAWVSGLEGAGVRVGGVMVYSPLEFTMIEGGRLAGSGVWADRTDWDPDDVFAAFSRRRDDLERIFDEVTTGGLVVASTHFNDDDVALALEAGRLLQILR